MTMIVTQGKFYNITLKTTANGMSIVIPDAKLYQVSIDNHHSPEMVFQYGQCHGTYQSITLYSANIESVEEVPTPEGRK